MELSDGSIVTPRRAATAAAAAGQARLLHGPNPDRSSAGSKKNSFFAAASAHQLNLTADHVTAVSKQGNRCTAISRLQPDDSAFHSQFRLPHMSQSYLLLCCQLTRARQQLQRMHSSMACSVLCTAEGAQSRCCWCSDHPLLMTRPPPSDQTT